MKRVIFTAISCVFLMQTANVFAAKLPSAGYDGPYQVSETDYDIISDELYNGSSDTPSGNIVFSTSAIAPGTGHCSEDGYEADITYCSSCLGYLHLPDGYTICDIEYAINGAGFGATQEERCEYATCAKSTCGMSLSESNPPLGCVAPVGAETPLIFFIFSYLALRLWRRKKGNV